ncbi:hypothetical protein AB7M42_008784 [Bradyrhizobium diazoefficiens]
MTDHSEGEQLNYYFIPFFLDRSKVKQDEIICGGKIDGNAGREFAALNMARHDLQFAVDCLTEAVELEKIDSDSVRSRSLIFAGVVSYARPFKTGVREIRLEKESFYELGARFDVDLHDYLVDLRDKHIAHSVSEFEQCEATTVMVGSADEKTWRLAGVAYSAMTIVGLTRATVARAIDHISSMLLHWTRA